MSGFNDGLKKASSGGAETVDVVAGETLAVGDVALISAGEGTKGRAYKSDSDDIWLGNNSSLLGIVTVGAAVGATATIQTSGTYSGGGLISMTPGLVYGLSSTPGDLALTAARPWIGVATASDEIQLSGLVTGLSSLVAGDAYGSNASGVLTAGLSESVGYAISSTTLQIRARFGATKPSTSAMTVPTAYWPFDDGSGTAIDNKLGDAAYDGVLSGSASAWQTTGVGSAALCPNLPSDGPARVIVDAYFGQMRTGGIMTGASTYSIQLWICNTWTGSWTGKDLYGADTTVSSPYPEGSFGYQRKPLIRGDGSYAASDLAQSVWHHLVFCQTGAAQKIYHNGVEILSGTGTSMTWDAGSDLNVFKSKYTSNYWTGYGCEVAWWDNYEVTAAEVGIMYDGSGTRTPGPLDFSTI